MNIAETFIAELGTYKAPTLKMLERVPAEKFTWKPHEKSMELRKLAVHVAELNGYIPFILTTEELDFFETGYHPIVPDTTAELVAHYEEELGKCNEELGRTNEEHFGKPWRILYKGNLVLELPRAAFVRREIGHFLHHRAQLGVYLRLLDIPVPNMFGPTADEQ